MVKKKEKWLIAQVKKDDCHVLGTHTLYVHINDMYLPSLKLKFLAYKGKN